MHFQDDRPMMGHGGPADFPAYTSALVLGLGSSGEAAARLLRARGVRVTVIDARKNPAMESRAALLRAAGCELRMGVETLPEGPFDGAILSPGISIEDPWVVTLKQRGISVISELELGWRACRSRVLAITGSNGKSTLVKFCRDTLEQGGFTAVAGGNYGVPLSALACLDPVPDWVVVEVSSFQLEAVDRFAPEVGVLLNLNPNHLDRHGSMEVYAGMKARLFARMTSGQTAVIPESASPQVRSAVPPGGRTVTFGLSGEAMYRYQDGVVVGPGLDHPVPVNDTAFDNEVMGMTAAACVAAMVGAGASAYAATAAAGNFERLPHRMQTVATVRGVTFVNDSKATNMAALSAGVRMAKGPVRLIAGGLLKETDLESVKKVLVNRVSGVYIIGKYSRVMAAAWQDVLSCVECADLKEAVHRAWSDSKPGEVILLSPGCASFDQFKSFEDRGEQFSAFARDIQKGA